MFSLELKLPTYHREGYDTFSQSGRLTVTADSYEELRLKAEELLRMNNAENRIVSSISSLESEEQRLKQRLENVKKQLENAQAQLTRLNDFLNAIGINSQQSTLTFSLQRLEDFRKDGTAEAVSKEVEVDPIPFKSSPWGEI